MAFCASFLAGHMLPALQEDPLPFLLEVSTECHLPFTLPGLLVTAWCLSAWCLILDLCLHPSPFRRIHTESWTYCLFVQWDGFSAPRGTESNINTLLSSSQTRDDFLGQVDVPLSHLPVRTDSSRLLHAGGGVLGISG